jgi:hypothetical protein
MICSHIANRLLAKGTKEKGFFTLRKGVYAAPSGLIQLRPFGPIVITALQAYDNYGMSGLVVFQTRFV